MELPQPRPFGGEGGRKPTHDFLSLYTSHSTAQQDPIPPSQGGYLETHDFLQPLERKGKTCAKEETSVEIISPSRSSVEKPPCVAQRPTSVEHILPGGIGTYSISHISYFNQRVPKPEENVFPVAPQASSTHERNDENSNCSSYAGSGFTLWDESAAMKGKTGKENVAERPGLRGQWTSSERPSQSSSTNNRNCFSSQSSGQKNLSFMEMMKSAAKGCTQEEELDDEEEFALKKEMSLLLPLPLPPTTVIEYIQYLQEKVTKYEGPYQGWNNDPAKLMPWHDIEQGNNKLGESYCDQSRGMNGGSGPALVFAAAKFEEKTTSVSTTIPGSAQNLVESDTSTETTFRAKDYPNGITNKAVPFPLSMQSNFSTPVRSGSAAPHFPPRLPSDAENTSSHPRSMLFPTKSCTADAGAISDKLKEHELTIEGGRINISSAYSQGLLNTLTQALQNSGVDLSQASISVQIELGKQACSRTAIPKSIVKENEIPSMTPGKKHPRISVGEDSEQAQKKLRTGRH
nr:basic helix-loop-helix family protein [Rosa persica]